MLELYVDVDFDVDFHYEDDLCAYGIVEMRMHGVI